MLFTYFLRNSEILQTPFAYCLLSSPISIQISSQRLNHTQGKMFIKPFKTKSNVQLKSSDRKKLQSKVVERYALSDDQLSLLFASKATISQIKIITHSDQIVTVYACDKKPLFFECPESGFLPTVYSLWLVPTMVPFFTTHPAVLPRLANGADLMLPGKANNDPKKKTQSLRVIFRRHQVWPRRSFIRLPQKRRNCCRQFVLKQSRCWNWTIGPVQ